MKLTIRQKTHLLCSMTNENLLKIFETTNIGWLAKQEMELKKSNNGWVDLFVNGDIYTSYNPNWLNKINLHID